jgi:hypothetical protein
LQWGRCSDFTRRRGELEEIYAVGDGKCEERTGSWDDIAASTRFTHRYQHKSSSNLILILHDTSRPEKTKRYHKELDARTPHQ